jgi:Mg2+-importing ATPase
MSALPLAYFGWLALTLVCYAGLIQWVKRLYIRRHGRWL